MANIGLQDTTLSSAMLPQLHTVTWSPIDTCNPMVTDASQLPSARLYLVRLCPFKGYGPSTVVGTRPNLGYASSVEKYARNMAI